MSCNKIKLIPLLWLMFINQLTSAQIIHGKITDSETHELISYAKIGILHKNIGTVSNAKGEYKLDLSKALPSDTLQISFIGHDRFVLPLQYMAVENGSLSTLDFELQPKSREMEEFVMTGTKKKSKRITLGNTTSNKLIVAGFNANNLGSEVGTVLKYDKKKKGKIEHVNFNIANNEYDTLFFRINLYRFKDGKIEENILKEPIYLTSTIKSGTLSIDMNQLNIYIEDDVLLSIEFLKDFRILSESGHGKRQLFFCAGFMNSDSYSRETSQADWGKVSAGLGFWAVVSYRK